MLCVTREYFYFLRSTGSYSFLISFFFLFFYNNARLAGGGSQKGDPPKRSPVESILKMTKTAWPKTRTTDNQITLLFVFHQKWTLIRVLEPACRGFAPPVKK